MAVTSAMALYAVIWFMTMLVVLPIIIRTQGEDGNVVPGTHEGAPADFRVRRTAVLVTIVATPIWAAIAYVIVFTDLSVRDIDYFGRMPPPTYETGE